MEITVSLVYIKISRQRYNAGFKK